MVRPSRAALGFVPLLAALAFACGSDNIIGPANQLEVTNAADNFQFQVSAMTNVTQTLTYNWTNTGTGASINQSSALTGGSATLTIRGPDGGLLYQGNLQNNGTYASSSGTAGTWQIEVAIDGADGMVNFRVQKAP